MDRADILELMTRLKLYGMRAAYDEVMTTAIKRRHEPARIVGELLSAEIADKQARSIKYQLTLAKLPLAKEIDDFDFAGTPINQALIRDLAGGNFIVQQRNTLLVGRTGTGKSHLALAIARLGVAATAAAHADVARLDGPRLFAGGVVQVRLDGGLGPSEPPGDLGDREPLLVAVVARERSSLAPFMLTIARGHRWRR